MKKSMKELTDKLQHGDIVEIDNGAYFLFKGSDCDGFHLEGINSGAVVTVSPTRVVHTWSYRERERWYEVELPSGHVLKHDWWVGAVCLVIIAACAFLILH